MGALCGWLLAGCKPSLDFGHQELIAEAGAPAPPVSVVHSNVPEDSDSGAAVIDTGLTPSLPAVDAAVVTTPDAQAPDAAILDAQVKPALDALAPLPAPDASEQDAEAGPASVSNWPLDVARPLSLVLNSADAGGVEPALPALRVAESELVMDGQLQDWGSAYWITLDRFADESGPSQVASEDLSAAFTIRWNPQALYLAVVVLDDVHVNTQSGFPIWDGDALQVAGSKGERLPYDWEYGWALTHSGAVAHSWLPEDDDLSYLIPFAVERSTRLTCYEVELPAALLGESSLQKHTELRLGLVLDESDEATAGRTGFLQLVEGIAQSPKSADQFLPVRWIDSN